MNARSLPKDIDVGKIISMMSHPSAGDTGSTTTLMRFVRVLNDLSSAPGQPAYPTISKISFYMRGNPELFVKILLSESGLDNVPNSQRQALASYVRDDPTRSARLLAEEAVLMPGTPPFLTNLAATLLRRSEADANTELRAFDRHEAPLLSVEEDIIVRRREGSKHPPKEVKAEKADGTAESSIGQIKETANQTASPISSSP